MGTLTLHVDDQIHSGWQSVRVTRSLDALAHSFELSVTDRWAGQNEPRRIRVGEPCALRIDNELVISGYVDEVQPEYSADSHSFTVRGRSKAGDFVDCSHPGVTYLKRNLLQIALDLCRPFDIDVIAETDIGDEFSSQRIEEGQTYFEFLSHLAAIRAVRLASTPTGDLRILRAGEEHMNAVLAMPGNIKSASATFSHIDRFSDYTVRSQLPGDNLFGGEAAALIEGKAADERIKRYRPMVIEAETPASKVECRQRAQWHRNTRYGRSQGVVYTVQGWRVNGRLWDYARRVQVRDNYLDLNAERLIESVVFSKDKDSGTVTELRVTDPAAYELLPLPEPQSKGFFDD